MDRDEPTVSASSTGREEPKRTQECTNMEESQRMKERRENADPRVTKSSASSEDSNLAWPQIKNGWGN